MEKIKKLLLFITLISFLYSCGGASDAAKVLRNEKTRSTDEFLVKKKQPLVLPPNFENIPAPDTIKKNKNQEDKIREILKIPEVKKNKNKSSSTEQSILEKIRK